MNKQANKMLGSTFGLVSFRVPSTFGSSFTAASLSAECETIIRRAARAARADARLAGTVA